MSLKEVDDGNRLVPQIGKLEAGGDGVAAEEVGNRVAPNKAFRAGGVIGLSDSHLVILHESAITRAQLGESAAFPAIQGYFRVVDRRRRSRDEVVFA